MVAAIARRCYSTAADSTATALRSLMRKVAQPVAVITVAMPSASSAARPDDAATEDNHGATLSSLSSISLSPPLVAFSLRLPSRLATHLLAGPAAPLNVHLLSSSQEHLARAFARQPPLPTPASPSPQPSSTEPPPTAHFDPTLFTELRKGSLGSMRCSIVHSIPLPALGTGTEQAEAEKAGAEAPRSELFIGRVEDVTLPSSERKGGEGSLVYWDQEYRSVGGK